MVEASQPQVVSACPAQIDAHVAVVVVGAGAAGLVSALRASANGAQVLLLERDAIATGSTSLSSGFVPAAGTRFQAALGIDDDSIEAFKSDILRKSDGLAHADLLELAVSHITPALEWLADNHAVEWQVLDDFLYPGHSFHRMHAVAGKTGSSLQQQLLAALQRVDVTLMCSAQVTTLYCNEQQDIVAVQLSRPDGQQETIGCDALILACNGYGGNPQLVRANIPDIANGPYFGHAGNTGDALLWGRQLGAACLHLSAYQGHGSVAHPHGILISWALMMEGGVQINQLGSRFSNEHAGYSEQAVAVLAQPGGVVWNLYDRRIHEFALGFPDYRQALDAGAVIAAADLAALASLTKLPMTALQATLNEISTLANANAEDQYGRRFAGAQHLQAPFYAVKVTGALFHTQGGLLVDQHCRVLSEQSQPFANLYAAGGAACGVSGPHVSGYLSGNGLLTAIAFGYVAGDHASSRR